MAFLKYLDGVTPDDFSQCHFPDRTFQSYDPKADLCTLDYNALDGKGLTVVVWAKLAYSGLKTTYFIAANDVIKITIAYPGTTIFYHEIRVTKEIENSAGLQVKVPNEALKKGLGKTCSVSFINYRAFAGGRGFARKHPQIFIAGLDLSAPRIEEAPSDVLDPAGLKTKGATQYATVILDYPEIAVGDTIILVREGVDANQNTIKFVDNERPISDYNVRNRPMKITWLATDITPFIGGSLEFYYKVFRGGKWYSSPRVSVGVEVGALSLPPFINQVVEDRLDPDSVIGSINVHVPPGATKVGDFVTLAWVGEGEAGSLEDRAKVDSNNVDGDLSFDVYESTVDPNRGLWVDVYYTITRTVAGKEVILRSPSLQFLVGSPTDVAVIPPTETIFPSPEVDGLIGSVVDVGRAKTGTIVTVPFDATGVGDNVSVYWRLVDEGSDFVAPAQNITAATVGKNLTFSIPAVEVAKGVGKKVTVFYRIVKAGADGSTTTVESLDKVFSVGSLDPGIWQAPYAPVASGDQLDPMLALAGVTVVVPAYPQMAKGDKVKLMWAGKKGLGSPIIEEQEVAAVGQLMFHVPASAVAYNIGGDVLLSYRVAKLGAETFSPSGQIFIPLFSSPVLTAPVVKPLTDGVMDLAVVTGDASITIAMWPLMTAGQRVWLRLEGRGEDNQPLILRRWTSKRLTDVDVSANLLHTVARADLLQFKHCSQINVYFEVGYDGDFRESRAQVFPSAEFIIRQPKAVVAALDMDVKTLALEPGYFAANGQPANPSPAGSFASRVPTGGKPPYSYASDREDVAKVDAAGKVMSVASGLGVIAVTDSLGARLEYTVWVRLLP